MLIEIAKKSPLWGPPNFTDDKVLYVELPPSQKLVVLDSDLEEVPIPEVKLGYLFEWRNQIHIKHKTFFDLNTRKIVEKEFNGLNEVIGNISFVAKSQDAAIFKIVDMEAEKVQWFILSAKDEVTLLEGVNSDHIYLNGEHVLFLTEEAIAAYNLKTRAIEWKLMFERIFPGTDYKHNWRFIVHEGKIFIIFIYTRGNMRIAATICLEAGTGQVLKIIEGYYGYMVLAGKKIYTASRHLVQILDTDTLEFVEVNVEEALDPHGLKISSGRSQVSEGLLFFIDGSVIPSNRFGILDLKEKKLLWHNTLEITDKYKCIDSLQLYRNNIYMFASDKTLQVFACI